LPDSAAGAFLGGPGSFLGSVDFSSSFFDFELVWAPPVLTTTPAGTCEVVDAVEVDVSSVSVAFSVAALAVSLSLSASVESDCFSGEGDGSDVDDSDDDSDDDGASAHATPYPYPVTTAAPTPRETAKLPTRPTNAAAFMIIAIRPSGGRPGGFGEKCKRRE
jgi:hypothetical protein